jgi:signal transduction histidine kinase/CheY-like chemotaxis protein
MTALENFIVINSGILLINLIISAILWAHRKTTLYRSVFLLWLTSIFSFLLQGVLTQNDFFVVLGFSSAFLINISLSHLLSRITDIRLPWKRFVGFLILGYALTVSGFFLQFPFTLVALPIVITVSFPALFTGCKVLFKKWNSISFSLKCLSITTCLLAIHNIDFAFLRNIESFAAIGFIIAILIVFCLSIFAPAVVLEVLADQINTLQRERLDVQKEAIDKMKRIDELKDEFLANTSHELKTPVHGIIGLSESLLEQADEKITGSIRHNLQLITACGKRLASLVDDILVFSRLKYKELSLSFQPLKLNTVVDIVLNLSHPLVGNKEIRLVNSVPTDFPPISADENRFQQILFNLVGNAIKYTDSGSIEVSAVIQGNRAQIAIADTGIGIEKDKQQQIFNTFEQLDGSETRSQGGVGLGLAISQKLVELHHGRIWVESELAKGSTFFITMPLADNEQIKTVNQEEKSHTAELSPPEPTAENTFLANKDWNCKKARDSGRFTILAVDDDPINQQVLENFLSATDFTISQAASGLEALELIRINGKPDLVLLDIMMPGMSGFEFCKRLRGEYAAHILPVIFLSAKNQISDIVEGFNLGGNDYIKKPFNKNELLARMQNCLYLLKVGEKLVSLRELNSQFGRIKTQKHLMTKILKEFHQNIFACQATLFLEDKLIEHYPQSGINDLLIEPLSENEMQQLFSNEGEEVVCHDSTNDNALKSNQRLIYIKIKGFEEYLIRLLTNYYNPMIHKNEIEYIRNIIREIKIIRYNLARIVSDWDVLEGIFQIRQKLNDVLYIRSQAPYCCIVYDAMEKNSLLLRTPIQNLDIFFEDRTLTRIHRSYLINPQNILSVQRKGIRDYEVQLKDNQGKQTTVPVGRSYHSTIKRMELARAFG